MTRPVIHSGTLTTIAFLYVTFVVPESAKLIGGLASNVETSAAAQITKEPNEETAIVQSASATGDVSTNGLCQYVDVFSSLRVALRSRPQRPLILALVFNFLCFILAYDGTEGTHRQLYATREFGWSEEQFSYFLSVYRICYLLTLWLLLPAMTKYLRWHNATISLVCASAAAIGSALPIAGECLQQNFGFEYRVRIDTEVPISNSNDPQL